MVQRSKTSSGDQRSEWQENERKARKELWGSQPRLKIKKKSQHYLDQL